MAIGLDLCSGICWSFVYVLAIVRGFRNRTWCIPWPNICMNLAWEFWVVVQRLYNGEADDYAFAVQLVWLILDVGVWLTWFIAIWKKPKLRSIGILFQLFCLLCFYLIGFWGREWLFSAFVINLIMSAFFCLQAPQKTGIWVSGLIAVAKLTGTLAATILNGVVNKNPVVLWIGGMILLLDIFYLQNIFATRNKECEL